MLWERSTLRVTLPSSFLQKVQIWVGICVSVPLPLVKCELIFGRYFTLDVECLIRWKLGQLSPGSTAQFRRISWSDSLHLLASHQKWLDAIDEMISLRTYPISSHPFDMKLEDTPQSPVLHRYSPSNNRMNSCDLQSHFDRF